MALSLMPPGVERSTDSNMSSTSPMESTEGRYFPGFGASTPSDGSSEMRFFSTIHPQNALIELMNLPWLSLETFFPPRWTR